MLNISFYLSHLTCYRCNSVGKRCWRLVAWL